MNPEKIKQKSRKLSWLLRHGAQEAGLSMDAAGWAPVEDVLRLVRLSPRELEVVVRENNKSRLQWEGDLIRACQGHSLEGTPVTLDALEASWRPYSSGEPVWHGTGLEQLPSIAQRGLLPQARSHVHLADGLQSRTGKRNGVAVMLEVSPQRMRTHGLGLFVSPNGVVLARHIPAACISGLTPVSRRAHARLDELKALFQDQPG